MEFKEIKNTGAMLLLVMNILSGCSGPREEDLSGLTTEQKTQFAEALCNQVEEGLASGDPLIGGGSHITGQHLDVYIPAALEEVDFPISNEALFRLYGTLTEVDFHEGFDEPSCESAVIDGLEG